MVICHSGTTSHVGKPFERLLYLAPNRLSDAMALLTMCVCVENNLVIIGGSIPVLRPLLRSKKPATLGSYTRTTDADQLRSATLKKKTVPGLPSAVTRHGSSEELMLEDGPWIKHESGCITRTTDVSVTYFDPYQPSPRLESAHFDPYHPSSKVRSF